MWARHEKTNPHKKARLVLLFHLSTGTFETSVNHSKNFGITQLERLVNKWEDSTSFAFVGLTQSLLECARATQILH
jgi:hypothetical protein